MQPSNRERFYSRYCIKQAPILDREFAGSHWSVLNRLVHEMIILYESARYSRPFEPIVEAARGILEADCGILFVRSSRGARLELRAYSGVRGPISLYRQPVNGMARAALFLNKPVLIDRDSLPEQMDDLLVREARTLVAVPIRAQGVPWGVVQLGRDRLFSEQEAALLWMFAMMVESALPAFSALTRTLQVQRENVVGDATSSLSAIDMNMIHAMLAVDTSSLLRLSWCRPGESGGLSSNPDAVRSILGTLGAGHRVMRCDDGDIVIALPSMNGSQAWALARSMRRALLQSNCFGSHEMASQSLRISSVTSPIDSGGPQELLHLLKSRLGDTCSSRPVSSIQAWKWNVP